MQPEKSWKSGPELGAMTESLAESSALALHQKIQSGERTAVSVLDETFEAIQKRDAVIGAFVSLNKEGAYQMAEAVDKAVAAGQSLPLLAGVPISIKNNISIQGNAVSCASKILAGYRAPFNATVVDKMAAAMMPIVGNTNLDEFAMGGSTENSALQLTKNPWNLDCVPGGSSGGSAAAVASGQTLLSLGSDTGGSVRQPASLCGLTGIKPTYGRVSRYGLVAFGSSLDQISPFARNTIDLAALLEVISGFDPADSTSARQPVPAFSKTVQDRANFSGLKIGVIQQLNGDGMQPAVAESFQHAIQHMQSDGAAVQSISIPSIDAAIAAYYLIATAEASSNLARFDGVRYGLRVEGEDINAMYCQTRAQGFGPEVKRRIMLGTFALSSGYYDAYYGKAQKVRALLRKQFEDAFQAVDVLVCPTSPATAFKIGEKSTDPVSMYLMDIATVPVNLVGVPAMNIPCGFDTSGLPIGLQLIAPHWQEEKLLQLAHCFEKLAAVPLNYPDSWERVKVNDSPMANA